MDASLCATPFPVRRASIDLRLSDRYGRGLRNRRDRWRSHTPRRAHVFIATKVLPWPFRRADMLMAADRSLERLRADHIDLYQLHWPDYTVPIDETMAAMGRTGGPGQGSIHRSQQLCGERPRKGTGISIQIQDRVEPGPI